MNQLENSSVSPVYMSQVEANEVMELWARRQREDAERQGMVTVHDVAEATQLSPQEVQHLLQSVRTSHERLEIPQRGAVVRQEDIPLLLAIVKVAPLTGIITFVMAQVLKNRGDRQDGLLIDGLMVWSFTMAVFVASKYIHRLASEARIGRAVQKRMRLRSDR